MYICAYLTRVSPQCFALHYIHPHTQAFVQRCWHCHATCWPAPPPELLSPHIQVRHHSWKNLVTASLQCVQKCEFNLKRHIICPWQHILTVAMCPWRTIGEGASDSITKLSVRHGGRALLLKEIKEPIWLWVVTALIQPLQTHLLSIKIDSPQCDATSMCTQECCMPRATTYRNCVATPCTAF